MIYLKSSDISSLVGNVDAIQLFLDQVLSDAGVENVVQIITYSTSTSMKLVDKRLVEKYKHVQPLASSCAREVQNDGLN